jgi:hypothetical protein
VQEHLDHKVNHRGISEEVRALQMRVDESNGLDDLQKHIFWSYAEAAAVMAASGDLSGFRLADIDVERLSSTVHATVISISITIPRSSVVDPHQVDADPDSTFYPVADPEPILILLGQNGN